MSGQVEGWGAHFPMEEQFEDCAGKMRTFTITCEDNIIGYAARAVDQGGGEAGYAFACFSETSPYNALGSLRQKIRKALASRHITGSPGDYRMLHDRIKGRITWTEKLGLTLVVDGVPMGIDDLATIFSAHEGWDFELAIVDSHE